MGDSFSRMDLQFAAQHQMGTQYLFSGERQESFTLTSSITVEEVYDSWQSALGTVREYALVNDMAINNEQELVMKTLSFTLEGFEYHENT